MKKLLDIGCGPGGINNIGLYEELKNEFSVFGIDLLEKNVKSIKERFPQGIFTIGTADKIPYPDNSFDYIIAHHVFEHVDNLEKSVSEIRRIGKNNSFLSIAVPDKYLEDILIRILPHYFEKGHHHQRVFSQKQLEDIISNHGYSIVKSSKGKWPMFVIVVLLAVISRFLGNIYMEEQSGIFIVNGRNYLRNKKFYVLYISLYKMLKVLNNFFPILNSLIPFEISILARKNENYD